MTGYGAAYAYSDTGNLLQVTASTGGVETFNTFEYEKGTDRLLRSYVQRSTDAVLVTDVAYGYNDAGGITSIADTPSDKAADVQCFDYDYLSRITEAYTTSVTDEEPCAAGSGAASVGGPAPYWHSYAYDAAGNRTSETLHGIGALAADTVRTYGYGETAHQVEQIASTTGSSTVNASYTYDETGNTVTRPDSVGTGTQTLAWNPEGSLASVTASAGTTTYVYDANGNRLIRKEPGAATLYLPGMELRLDKSTGSVAGTRYVEVGGGVSAVRTTAGVWFTCADHHGTGQVAINAATGAVAQRRFTPFGATRGVAPASWPTEKGYIGGTADSTGMTHLGAREYDPSIGRFISVDPVQDIANQQQWNGYSYAENNPVTRADPTGLMSADSMEHWIGNGQMATTPQGNVTAGYGFGIWNPWWYPGTSKGPGGATYPGEPLKKPEGAPATPAHATAVMLRVRNLEINFPGKHITSNPFNTPGGDIICWDCKEGEIWVWEVRPVGADQGKAQDDLDATITKLKSDVRTEGLKATPVRGPNNMFIPSSETAQTVGKASQTTTVMNSSWEGVQLYRTRDTDEDLYGTPYGQASMEAVRANEHANAHAEIELERVVRTSHPEDPTSFSRDVGSFFTVMAVPIICMSTPVGAVAAPVAATVALQLVAQG